MQKASDKDEKETVKSQLDAQGNPLPKAHDGKDTHGVKVEGAEGKIISNKPASK